VISPDPISLGILTPGHAGGARYTVFNPATVTLTLERIETSCPCVKTSDGPIRIEPGEVKTLAIEFDPFDDPKFRGGLNVEMSGRGAGDVTLFRTHVVLEVIGEARP